MIVVTPNFTGNLTIPVRQPSPLNYWFVLIDKQRNTYTAYAIAGTSVIVSGIKVTFPVSLPTEEGCQYVYYLFSQNTGLVDETGSADEFYRLLQIIKEGGQQISPFLASSELLASIDALLASGTLYCETTATQAEELARGRIFATQQDPKHYSTVADVFKEVASDDNEFIII